jgi:acetyl esterase/lipase
MERPRIIRDLEYHRVPGKVLQLDLYLPARQPAPCRLIIWIHGGAFRTGDRRQGVEALPLVEKGYAVASITYRLSQEAIFPALIHDCKTAVRWLRAHAALYGFDPGRFGAWGPSAGGYLVSFLGTTAGVAEFEGSGPYQQQSSAVQAVCDWFGPTDFIHMQWSQLAHAAV